MLHLTKQKLHELACLSSALQTDTCNPHQPSKLLGHDTEQEISRNQDLLTMASRYYAALSNFRTRRERAVNFYRGRQWDDPITVNGQTMTEEMYISMQGRPALKQNMIRPPLRNLIGQYRNNPTKPLVFARNRNKQKAAEMMSIALESVLDMNDGHNRDARQFEEFLISGCAIYRTSFSMDAERQQAIPKFRAVSPNRFFVNTDYEDLQGSDVDFVGEISDLSFEELITTYAHTPADQQFLRQVYGDDSQRTVQSATDALKSVCMADNGSNGKCRVIEIWKKECDWQLYCHDYLDGSFFTMTVDRVEEVENENKRREKLSAEMNMPVHKIVYKQQYISVWHCFHLTPFGQTLYEQVSPYQHGSHPFVFTFYPMLNSECWGMVEDLIDQQKMINRNMILFDFINGASAKGVLLVPEECIPEDFTLEDIAEEWTRYNGVIKIKARAGAQIPHQITSSAIHTGLMDMIQMQVKMMEDIGGVSNAMQGRAAGSGTPSSLYAQESQNSSINTLDYVETFNNFIRQRDKRLIQLIRQFFTSKQYINISGKDYSEEAHLFDPDAVRNVDFDNTIVQSNATPAFRTLIDNTMMQLLQQHIISPETYLENCSLPYADRILQQMRKEQTDNTDMNNLVDNLSQNESIAPQNP